MYMMRVCVRMTLVGDWWFYLPLTGDVVIEVTPSAVGNRYDEGTDMTITCSVPKLSRHQYIVYWSQPGQTRRRQDTIRSVLHAVHVVYFLFKSKRSLRF